MPPLHRPDRCAFTLIELIVTISIILILAGILLPVMGKVRDSASQAKCVAYQKNAFTAARLYAVEHDDEIVPGSTKPDGSDAELWPAKLVTYYSQVDNSQSASFACPKYKVDLAVSKTPFNWGYAMNVTPGYEGASSDTEQKKASVVTSTSGKTFRYVNITNVAKRLFFCDGTEWHVRGTQVVPGTPGKTFASYNRHGSNRCNVTFFDGHSETLSPKSVDSAIYDPANFVNTTN